MRSRSRSATVLVGTLLLTACAPSDTPTYPEVRAQAEDAVVQIVDALPDGAEYTAGEETPATSCESDVAPEDGPAGTAFATLRGTVALPAGSDPASVVEELPARLGEGWALEPTAIDVDLAAARLSQASTSVSVDVVETSVGGMPGLDLLAVSACGRAE